MTGRKLLTVYIGLIMMTALSSCFNIFSVLAPTTPDATEDVDRLVAMGQQYLNVLDYSNAYVAFSKAYGLAPSNSTAIEGMCTAYVFLQVPVTNIIGAIATGTYSNMGFNNVYRAAGFVSEYMYKIVGKQSDGVIPYDDFNANVNFFAFNTIYAAFFIADTDNDMDIQLDTNDYFLISNDFTFSARVPNLTNNFVETIKLINAMRSKVNGFVLLMNRSEASLAILSNKIHSASGQALLTNLEAQLFAVKDMILTNFNEISNITALSQFNLLGDNYNLTNVLANYFTTNDFALFTNQMYQAGVTNLDDMASMVTNIYPDLTNFNDIIYSYFVTN